MASGRAKIPIVCNLKITCIQSILKSQIIILQPIFPIVLVTLSQWSLINVLMSFYSVCSLRHSTGWIT